MLNPFEQLRILQPGPHQCFEEVTSHILRRTVQDSKRVRVHRGDEGVDSFTGTWGEDGELDVYQIKYFVEKWGPSQQDQIRSSYKRARENDNYQLRSWFLVVPTNLTAQDFRWIYEWKSKQDRPIELIDGSDLCDRLNEAECSAARDLLHRWGVLGVAGGAFLVPSLTVLTSERFPTILRLRLENRGDKTAKAVRITIEHSETHTVANTAYEDSWRDVGGGVLNPRRLEALKAINPGESYGVLPIPFREQPNDDVEVSVRITGEDMQPFEGRVVISPSDLERGAAPPFTAGPGADAPDKKKADDMIVDVGTTHSQTAKEILQMLTEMGPFEEPALHVIQQPFPGNPTQTGFFIGEASAPGGSAYGVKTRLLDAAVKELLESGYLHTPVEGPGTLVYEFLQQQTEQDGADQPATAPELKSEGDEKPKSEAEGRSQ